MNEKEIIIISKTNDLEFRKNLERLHYIVPEYLEDTGDNVSNPFIDYIIGRDAIRRDLFEFLYHSDFLSDITESSLKLAKHLYDIGADIHWFNLIQSVFEEKEDKDEYCDVIFKCLNSGISVEDARFIFEVSTDASNMSANLDKRIAISGDSGDSDIRRDKVSANEVPGAYNEFLSTQNALIDRLRDENDALKEQLNGHYQNLEEAYRSVREGKKELLDIKTDNERAYKLIEKYEGLVQTCRDKVEEFAVQIHTLESKLLDNSVGADEYEDKIRTLNEELNKKDDTISNLNVALQQQNDILSKYRKENAELTEFNAQFEEELNKYRSGNYVGSEEDPAVNYPDMDESLIDNEVSAAESYEEKKDDDIKSNILNFADYIPYSEPDESVKEKKCNWFANLILKHSERAFNKKPRNEQENLIFIKMMEMAFSAEKTQLVRKHLNNTGSCYELYKYISKNPSIEELERFFEEYEEEKQAV